jgi:hypothetical protein
VPDRDGTDSAGAEFAGSEAFGNVRSIALEASDECHRMCSATVKTSAISRRFLAPARHEWQAANAAIPLRKRLRALADSEVFSRALRRRYDSLRGSATYPSARPAHRNARALSLSFQKQSYAMTADASVRMLFDYGCRRCRY